MTRPRERPQLRAIAVALLALISTTPASSEEPNRAAARTVEAANGTRPNGRRIVVVDPGHNGANGRHPRTIRRPVDAGGFTKACNTTGAQSTDGYTESAFNWSVAMLLQAQLESRGWTAVLTRSDDRGVGPCIDERGATAGRTGAVALLSIHADGGPATGRGFHVIAPRSRPGYTEHTAVASARLAAATRDALVAAGFTPSTYAGSNGLDVRGDLGTLNRSAAPAVIVEAGNLANRSDAARLRDPVVQRRLAVALADALERWSAAESARR